MGRQPAAAASPPGHQPPTTSCQPPRLLPTTSSYHTTLRTTRNHCAPRRSCEATSTSQTTSTADCLGGRWPPRRPILASGAPDHTRAPGRSGPRIGAGVHLCRRRRNIHNKTTTAATTATTTNATNATTIAAAAARDEPIRPVPRDLEPPESKKTELLWLSVPYRVSITVGSFVVFPAIERSLLG